MKRSNSRTVRLKLRLKLYHNGEMIHRATFHKRSSVWSIIKLLESHSGYLQPGDGRKVDRMFLQVFYDTSDDWNASWHTDTTDLLRALSDYTEHELLNYIEATA